MKFDSRILNIEIQFDDGSRIFQSPLNIKVSGSKTITTIQNTCNIQISNLNNSDRDYLMSNCNQNLASSFKVRKVLVTAGRQSSDAWQVFQGDIVSASVTQPPDVTTVMRALTNAQDRTQWRAISNTSPKPLGEIAKDIASILNLSTRFSSDVDLNKIIPRFTFNGEGYGLVVRLSEMADIRAFVDDGTLVLTNWNSGLKDTIVEVNKATGMIGIPEFTEYGVRVKTLADRRIVLGGGIRLTSEQVPVMNADYVVTRLDYDLSTRDQSFYYDVWANRSG